jgi:tRNA pseudouridine55 synthase
MKAELSISNAIEKITDGYIANINKPEDWTSFDVVKKIRSITRIKKTGHAGTLDPFATGVLLVCLGKATKLVTELQALPKTYEAILRLGEETDTLDRTGTVIRKAEVPELTMAKIEQAFAEFKGIIQQRIPDYSASKVGGKRSYKLARQGKEIPARFKSVEIFNLTPLDISEREIRFAVQCGSGTFVRTLGVDIAAKLGTIGHLTELIRTSIGRYRIENAVSLEDFSTIWTNYTGNENISTN